MSVALHGSSGVKVEPPGFSIGATWPLAFDSPELNSSGVEGAMATPVPTRSGSSSAGLSSIRKENDNTENQSSRGGGEEEEEDKEENEVQSSYKGPLEMMDALEEVLPMRKIDQSSSI